MAVQPWVDYFVLYFPFATTGSERGFSDCFWIEVLCRNILYAPNSSFCISNGIIEILTYLIPNTLLLYRLHRRTRQRGKVRLERSGSAIIKSLLP